MIAVATRPSARRVWCSRAAAGAVALAAVFMGTLAVIGDPAADGLDVGVTGVAPPDGASLAVPPGVVALTLAPGAVPSQVHLTVASALGASVTTSEVRVAGQRATVTVEILDVGEYLVAYHVVLTDGRQASGVTRFAVNPEGVDLAAAPAVAASGGHAHGGDDPLSIGLVCLDGLLVTGLVLLLVRRPRARRG